MKGSPQRRSWLKRQATYERWIHSFRAGRNLWKLPMRDRFNKLVKPVQTKDRFGIVEEHLIPVRPRQRIRINGRRVALQTAAWMIKHGPINSQYRTVAVCGVSNCCLIEHLSLQFVGGNHAHQ